MKAVTADVGTADSTRVTRRGFIASAFLLMVGALVGAKLVREAPETEQVWPKVPEGRDAYVAYHDFGQLEQVNRDHMRRIAQMCLRERPDMMDKLILRNRLVREWL